MTLVEPGTPGALPVTVWDLEMASAPAAGQPPPPPVDDLELRHHDRPEPELSRRFYGLVGADWHWVDRLGWSPERWQAWVDRPELHLSTCWTAAGDPVGYFELEQQRGSDTAGSPTGETAAAGGSRGSSFDTVELAYFGLVPAHHGRGIGRWLLEQAITEAWSLPGTERVWLHTCSLDGPAAKANYEARGFQVCRESTEYRLVP